MMLLVCLTACLLFCSGNCNWYVSGKAFLCQLNVGLNVFFFFFWFFFILFGFFFSHFHLSTETLATTILHKNSGNNSSSNMYINKASCLSSTKLNSVLTCGKILWHVREATAHQKQKRFLI